MKKRSRSGGRTGAFWLYGIHAVRAALQNPRRRCLHCMLTARAADNFGTQLLNRVDREIVDAGQITRVLPPGAVHQGVALSCDPLPRSSLDDVIRQPGSKIVLVLDQISDPQNVGAVLRSAAAFEANAVIVQDRHAPAESGALAKAASGGLDVVPYLPVVNIARALEELGNAGFWRVGLAGDAGRTLAEGMVAGDIAIVLGSEGEGLRHLVRARCDDTVVIPMGNQMDSLNVSNAAAIALYECRRRHGASFPG